VTLNFLEQILIKYIDCRSFCRSTDGSSNGGTACRSQSDSNVSTGFTISNCGSVLFSIPAAEVPQSRTSSGPSLAEIFPVSISRARAYSIYLYPDLILRPSTNIDFETSPLQARRYDFSLFFLLFMALRDRTCLACS